MTAARYWRVVGIRAYGGGEIEITAARLADAAGVPVVESAVLTCTGIVAGGSLSNLSDADLTTGARFDTSSNGFALGWDFGAGVTVSVSNLLIGASDLIEDFVSEYTLQYSDTGVDWVTLRNVGRILWPGANTLNALGVGDAFYDNTSLLLHADGLHGSTVVTDSSVSPKTMTAKGNAALSTVYAAFGGASLRMTGAVGDGVYSPYNAAFDFGTGDFCIEFSLRLSSWGLEGIFGLYYTHVIGCREQLLTTGWAVWLTGTSSGRSAIQMRIGGVDTSFSYTWPLGSFVKVKLYRVGTTVYCVVDDTLIGTATNSASGDGSQMLTIGYHRDTTRGDTFVLDGYIDEIRVTKGVSRDSESAVSEPFPDGLSGDVVVPVPVFALARVDASTTLGADVGDAEVLQPQPSVAIDHEDGGGLAIVGTVKEASLPVNHPLARRVRLINELDGRVVRETWSDTAGDYSFSGIRGGRKYSVISYDHLHNYRAVIADNQEAA